MNQNAKKRFADMTDKEQKAYRVKKQLEYLKTENGKASTARKLAKCAKTLSPVQIGILEALKEGAYIRHWLQDFCPTGWHCELRSSNNKVLKPMVPTHTVELLQSEKKQGMLLKIKSERKNEIIYVISKKGLQALDKLDK